MPTKNPDYDYSDKLIIIGDATVGKSNLAKRIESDKFDDQVTATICIEFLTSTKTHHGKRFKLLCWDTAGARKYDSIRRSYFGNARIIIACFDLTAPEKTLTALKDILEASRGAITKDTPMMLVGTKCDLPFDEAEVETQVAKFIATHQNEAFQFITTNDQSYIATSAKNNTGIQDKLVPAILTRLSMINEAHEQKNLNRGLSEKSFNTAYNKNTEQPTGFERFKQFVKNRKNIRRAIIISSALLGAALMLTGFGMIGIFAAAAATTAVAAITTAAAALAAAFGSASALGITLAISGFLTAGLATLVGSTIFTVKTRAPSPKAPADGRLEYSQGHKNIFRRLFGACSRPKTVETILTAQSNANNGRTHRWADPVSKTTSQTLTKKPGIAN